jgi:hypothetical protein
MRWRLQFSLSLLLWLTLCLALLVTSILMYRRVGEAERAKADAEGQMELMRMAIGYLKIGDKTLVHGREIETREPLAWKWRMFLPENRHFIAKMACGEIPADGMPTISDVTGELQLPFNGELVVSVNTHQSSTGDWTMDVDARNEKFDFAKLMYSSSAGASASFRIPDSIATLYTRISGEQVISFGGFEIQTNPADHPIVLRRDRFPRNQDGTDTQSTYSTFTVSSEPAPGVMIWLEEVK